MKNTLTIIALLSSLIVKGQQLEIGLNSGLSYTKISTDPLIWRVYSSRQEGSVLENKRLNITTEFYLKRQHKHWFYQVGIQNIQFGEHSTDTRATNNIYRTGDAKVNFSYLHLPIRFGYRIGRKRLKILVQAGASPGYLLQHQLKFDDHPNPDLRKIKPIGVEKFNFNVLTGLGLMYELNENFDLQIQFTRQIGLKNMSNEMYFPNTYFFQRGSFLTVGLNYKINNKSKSE